MPASIPKYAHNESASKPKRIPERKFNEVSERLIERDFFPELHKKRLAEEIIDLTDSQAPNDSKVKSKKKSHQELDPLRIASVGLDEFNAQYVAKSTVDLQQSLSDTKKNRNERLHGITDQKQLNPFMFNHPGISFTSNRRPRVNFENTRFPEGFVFEEPKRRAPRNPPSGIPDVDILQRSRKS